MDITLSVAMSCDLYIDDNTPQRLLLSTPEDWDEVYRLRACHDAILVGGETLRRDNPSLGIKSEGVEPMRVIVSGEGDIPLSSKIFHKGEGRIVIFSNIERAELKGVATVIVSERIDVPLIVTQLEKMGVRRLFVEGGAKILRLFMESTMVSTLRVAINPAIMVDDVEAPRFDPLEWVEVKKDVIKCVEQNLGGMEVTTYHFNNIYSRGGDELYDTFDEELMRRVIEVSRRSPERDSCYRVGAIIKTLKGEIFEGYTLETSPTDHAEQAALHKALEAGADVAGATIYSSMEPCSTRKSAPESCSQLIIRYRLSRALFALYEPSHFVECHGAENLRRAGVEVIYMPQFGEDVLRINSHLHLI